MTSQSPHHRGTCDATWLNFSFSHPGLLCIIWTFRRDMNGFDLDLLYRIVRIFIPPPRSHPRWIALSVGGSNSNSRSSSRRAPLFCLVCCCPKERVNHRNKKKSSRLLHYESNLRSAAGRGAPQEGLNSLLRIGTRWLRQRKTLARDRFGSTVLFTTLLSSALSFFSSFPVEFKELSDTNLKDFNILQLIFLPVLWFRNWQIYKLLVWYGFSLFCLYFS